MLLLVVLVILVGGTDAITLPVFGAVSVVAVSPLARALLVLVRGVEGGKFVLLKVMSIHHLLVMVGHQVLVGVQHLGVHLRPGQIHSHILFLRKDGFFEFVFRPLWQIVMMSITVIHSSSIDSLLCLAILVYYQAST